ncbi:MAG: hypothetical protein C0483_02210 [Pirellula sp.]|nr:hypothetical protein [Pirellula sp.]
MSTQSLSGFSKAAAAVAAGLGTAGLIVMLCGGDASADREARAPTPHTAPLLTKVAHREAADPTKSTAAGIVRARPAPEFIDKGLVWLIDAQHKDGGWGAGSHAKQDIRDPHAVVVDPATTAFVASALLRYGHTPASGKYQANARRATEYLCSVVEEYTKPGPKITELEGTQIQSKLGPLVDTAMTAQYLARALAVLPKSDSLHGRVDKALDKCLAKLGEAQQKDGSWNVGGGWANVLQSSLGCSAFEYAQAAGKKVDQGRLDLARKYHGDNFDAKTGIVKTGASAGIALYANNSSFRANAANSRAATDFIEKAKQEGKLPADAPLNEENLKIAGVKAGVASLLMSANGSATSQSMTLNGVNTFTGGTSTVSGDLVASAKPALPTSGPVAAAPPIESVASTTDVSGITLGSAGTTVVGAGTLTFSGGVISSPVTRSSAGLPAGAAAATDDEALLAGFGNNGGEEFLSYMLASESMVILGEKDWNQWYDRMSGRLSKVQNPDGSWSGHHCITSPVFCTAAVVQTMTADHDAEMLTRLAKEAAAIAKVDEKSDDKKEVLVKNQ